MMTFGLPVDPLDAMPWAGSGHDIGKRRRVEVHARREVVE